VRKFQVIALFILLLASAQVGRAQSEHIFLVKMFECGHAPVERSQTGFRVRGTKGVYTALHGVADCKRIMVSVRRGPVLTQPFAIEKVDISRDVALISSPELAQQEAAGLEVADRVAWETLTRIEVYGHPYGLNGLQTTLELRRPPTTELKELLPAAPLSVMRARQSPNHLTQVMSIQGNLLPGHSGAPILDPNGRVLGIANGGLKEGAVGISWAVPFQGIKWDEEGWAARVRALAQLNPNVLFAAEAAPVDLTSEAATNSLCGPISKLVEASKTGFDSIIGEPIFPGTSYASFKTTIELPGATYGSVKPKRPASYTMYETDVAAMAESQMYGLASRITSCLPTWQKKEEDLTGYKGYKFRERAGSTIITVAYNLEPSKYGSKHALLLTVDPPPELGWE